MADEMKTSTLVHQLAFEPAFCLLDPAALLPTN